MMSKVNGNPVVCRDDFIAEFSEAGAEKGAYLFDLVLDRDNDGDYDKEDILLAASSDFPIGAQFIGAVLTRGTPYANALRAPQSKGALIKMVASVGNPDHIVFEAETNSHLNDATALTSSD